MKITIEHGEGVITLGQQVAMYAYSFLGRKVRDGECAMLAVHVLEGAGCKTTNDYGVSGPTADYIWGDKVGKWVGSFYDLPTIVPGCIIQYRNVVFKKPNGTDHKTKHHTAVVYERTAVAGVYKTLEQNVGPPDMPSAKKRIVQLKERDYRPVSGGTLWIYYPVGNKKKK